MQPHTWIKTAMEATCRRMRPRPFHTRLLATKARGRNRAVVVAWPDAETDDNEYQVTTPNQLVYKPHPHPSAPSSSSSSQPPKSWNTTPQSNLRPKSAASWSATRSTTKPPLDSPATTTTHVEYSQEKTFLSPIDQARARFETGNESTISPTSISSEPVKPSWQRGSVTKRYAPWEKQNDSATTPTPEHAKSASHNSVTPKRRRHGKLPQHPKEICNPTLWKATTLALLDPW
jgi:hypothetical protein